MPNPPPTPRRRLPCLLLGTLLLLAATRLHAGAVFQTNDVIALVGGATTVAIDQTGQVELALTLAHPGHRLRFRSLAFEGDTVHGQPRELNFPDLPSSLRRVGATVTCIQFGALESFAGPSGLDRFSHDLRQRLDEIASATPRMVVVIPPPFETKPPPLPDLAPRNADLARYADVLRSAAAARNAPVIDLFARFTTSGPGESWTFDGRELSPAGHRAVAAAWVSATGRPDLAEQFAAPAFWSRPDTLELRHAIAMRSRLWFDYWRPMNWAFLNGDRTEQQSSRDHRDPSRRWFPEEMQEFLPLLSETEARIESLATPFQTTR